MANLSYSVHARERVSEFVPDPDLDRLAKQACDAAEKSTGWSEGAEFIFDIEDKNYVYEGIELSSFTVCHCGDSYEVFYYDGTAAETITANCSWDRTPYLCEVIVGLADAVARRFEERAAWENLLIHILQSAPVYRNAGRLDAWNEAYCCARRGRDGTPVIDLLDAIADLGSYNTYGAFDVPGTKTEYARVVGILAGEGVRGPEGSEITDW